MTNIHQSAHSLRPRLSTISPLVHWISTGFMWLNIWLAFIIWTTPQAKLIIYNHGTTQQFWSVVFVLLAAGVLYGILSNRWRVVRYSLVAGLFVKAVFLYALIVLAAQTSFDSVEGSLALWLFLVWVQIGAVMFFLPPVPKEIKNG